MRPRRALLHRKVFEVLRQWSEDGPGSRRSSVSASELARHLVAVPGPTSRAPSSDYARRAAEEAMAALNPDEAVRWYSTALDALGDDGAGATRAQVLSRSATPSARPATSTYRATLLEAARLALESDDVDTLVFAALANSRQIQSTTGTIDQERVDVLEAAIDRVGTEDTPERARLLAHLAVDRSYDGEPERRRPLVEEALVIARRVGDPATLFDVLLRRVGIWMPEDVGERLAESAEALAIAEALDDPVARFWALFYRSIVAAEAGDRALLDECRHRFPGEARVDRSAHAAVGDHVRAELAARSSRATSTVPSSWPPRPSNSAWRRASPTPWPIYGGSAGGPAVAPGPGRRAGGTRRADGGLDAGHRQLPAALARIYADIGRTERRPGRCWRRRGGGGLRPALRPAGRDHRRAVGRGGRPDGGPRRCRGPAPAPGVLRRPGGLQRGGHLRLTRPLPRARCAHCSAIWRGGAPPGAGLAVHEALGAPFFEARSHLELARCTGRGGPGDADEARRRAGLARSLARRFGYATVEQRAEGLAT